MCIYCWVPQTGLFVFLLKNGPVILDNHCIIRKAKFWGQVVKAQCQISSDWSGSHCWNNEVFFTTMKHWDPILSNISKKKRSDTEYYWNPSLWDHICFNPVGDTTLIWVMLGQSQSWVPPCITQRSAPWGPRFKSECCIKTLSMNCSSPITYDIKVDDNQLCIVVQS